MSSNDINPQLEKTISINIEEEKKRQDALDGLFPLTCYIYDSENWRSRPFLNRNKKNLTIGDSRDHDLTIKTLDDQSFEAALRVVGHMWYLIRKKGENPRFNGLDKMQDIVLANDSTLFEVDGARIILTTRSDSETAKLAPATGAPQSGEYGVQIDEQNFRFPIGKTLLIGSNNICDLKLAHDSEKPQNAFSAIISSNNNCITFYPFGFVPFNVNGELASSLTELRNGSTISNENFNMKLILPEDHTPGSKGAESGKGLCFMEIDENGNPGYRVSLPSFGKSIYIGRSSKTENTLQIKCSNISRQHSQIIVYEGSIMLLDCYSTNGTFINDEKIGKKRAYPGDIVGFAETRFLLCFEE